MRKDEAMNPKEFEIEFFKKNKFTRQTCSKCKSMFWSTKKRKTCGEPPCEEYTFIGKPIIPKKYNLFEMRKKFIGWFADNGHTPIGRYPVVSRWKPDTMFAGASIYCFMPWVLNGTIEPPANPLIISQPSFRAQDLDNIGLGTARHTTIFEMVGHHAFNHYENEIYWKERTCELCYRWMKDLGIKPDDMIFIENWWEGGGNAGPCFEVIVGGAEIATLVFMKYRGPINGNYELMDLQVVDTGYGLERHVWISQGTPTVYDCIYPEIIDWLAKKAGVSKDEKIFSEFCKACGMLDIGKVNVDEARKKIVSEISKKLKIKEDEIMGTITPFHSIYQIADHSKSIMFILGDGVVPSNVEEGYIARLLIRRGIRALQDIGLNVKFSDVVKKQIEYYKDDFPEFFENKDDIIKMVEVEEEKYADTLKRGESIVEKFEKKITENDLIMLYDSHGLLPRDVKKFAKVPVASISDVETKIAVKKTSAKKEQEKHPYEIKNVPNTEPLYYEDEKKFDFKAKVLKIVKENSASFVVLDKTCFYPRGGGQEPDHGTLNGCKVYDAEKFGKIVIHYVENPNFKEGDIVEGKVDKNRRVQIVKHHSATHVINGSARKILGNHIWQGGSKKDIDKAHLDITHYDNLSEEQIRAIESDANNIIKKSIKTQKLTLDRTSAEKDYGFRIYQGGAVPGKMLKIFKIGDHDVEACGGLQVDNTKEIEEIYIFDTKRLQDGLIRLFYVAGYELCKKKREEMSGKKESEKEIAERKIAEFETKKNEKKFARDEATKLIGCTPDFEKNGIKLFARKYDMSLESIIVISKIVAEGKTIAAIIGEDSFVLSAGKDVPKSINLGEVAKKFNGGGGPSFGSGKSTDLNGIKKEIMKIIK